MKAQFVTLPSTYPLQLCQGPAHAHYELVESLHLLQKHHRCGGDLQPQLLANQIQVEHFRQLVLDVFGHLANVLVAANSTTRLSCQMK